MVMSTNIKADVNYFEITYIKDGYTFRENICTGIIDDAGLVLKFIRTKYKVIEVRKIQRLEL